MGNPTETEAILAAGVAISKNVGVLKAFRQAVEDELGAIAGATGLSIINGKK